MDNSATMHHVPTLKKRLWRWLGFCYQRNDLPDGIEATHPGWMLTTAKFKFTFWDRIRLLFCSEFEIEIRQATTQQVDNSVNAVSFQIKPPF